MFAVDFLVAALLWLVWYEVRKVNLAIDSNADTIRLYGSIFMILIGLIVPALHAIFTINFLWPGFADKNMAKGISINWFIILLFASLFAFSFCVKIYFIEHIESRGYTYCPEKIESTSFSKILVFVRQESDCISN